jgi:hypothetical protein
LLGLLPLSDAARLDMLGRGRRMFCTVRSAVLGQWCGECGTADCACGVSVLVGARLTQSLAEALLVLLERKRGAAL